METVTMYYYFNKRGTQLWTSSENYALKRANHFDSDFFKVDYEVPKKKFY